MNNLLPTISSLLAPSSSPAFHLCLRHRFPSCSRRFDTFCRWAPPSSRRRRRRIARRWENLNRPPSTVEEETTVKVVIDVAGAKARVSNAVEDFVLAGEEAIRDLSTLISFDQDRRMIISCRRSSLEFLGMLVACSLCLVALARALARLSIVFRGRKWKGGSGSGVVVRRDRSLGGREVVVATRSGEWETGRSQKDFDAPNPLSAIQTVRLEKGEREKRFSKVEKLPGWWPKMESSQAKLFVEPEFQREAHRIMRAIMNNRLMGRDITDDDILQLRRVCRASGARVSFDTLNTRDSFYRASVNFVLDICCSKIWDKAMVQVDGEDAPHFLAGLAENIGLENIRASTIISASVAARVRSLFLQAWALEMQGERSQSLQELQKICLVLQTFLPDEHSPEMEMVAKSLEKHLKLAQREQLLNLYTGVCSTHSRSIAAEALGLDFESP
ncbi:uncharacterized protein LOC116251271 [Nymphaea colorata]|nr:uncharacterized protein LOC116251271 [Nymphaea colorata]